jgi:c-di-GMP-binding flagellar brake protein YcgR
MVKQRERRIPVQCPIYIQGNQGVNSGVLFNLSQGGGAIESGASVQCGTVLTLRVHLPSPNQPIEVNQAQVTWRAGDDFGVQFLRLEPAARERLNQVIADLLRGIQQQQAHVNA